MAAEPNSREELVEDLRRVTQKYGPDSHIAKVYREQLRLYDSGASSKSATETYFSGSGRPVD